MSKNIIWWEKTVEYLFVKNSNFLKVSPLDGEHEQAGDVILQNPNGKYYLIEFKKESNLQKQEFTKYIKEREYEDKGKCNTNRARYQEIIAEIAESFKKDTGFSKLGLNDDEVEKLKCLKEDAIAAYHFVVFGKLKPNEKQLILNAQQYMDYLVAKKDDSSFILVDKFREHFNKVAADKEEFLKYVYKIINLKAGKEFIYAEGKTSSSAFANVLAINSEGETCTLLDIVNSQAYQEKFPSLSLEKIANDLVSIQNELDKPSEELELKIIEERINTIDSFEDYLNCIQQGLQGKREEIERIFKKIEDLLSDLNKRKQKLTPYKNNALKI